MKTSFKKELLKAKEGHYALPAFNFDSLEMLKGIIEAAEEVKSPVIIMSTESAAKYMGIEFCAAIGRTARDNAKVPVILHWDHGFDINLVKKAVDNGYDSVMLDASLKPIKENVEQTIEVVKYAHAKGVEVESEIGHVGGKEDDNNSTSKTFTTVQEAVDFNKKTGIDALAIAVGTAHGVYKSEPHLEIQRIKDIAKVVSTPLVLHGSSGVPSDQINAAIDAGICKVNIGTDLKIANAEGLKAWFKANPNGFDARKFGRSSVDFVKKEAIEKIKMLRADNKA